MTTYSLPCRLSVTNTNNVVLAPTPFSYAYAKVSYLDSASPLTVVNWTGAMAVTAGTAYVVSGCALHYYLCVASGTTTSLPDVNYMNTRIGSIAGFGGGSSFRVMPFHGWSKAYKPPSGVRISLQTGSAGYPPKQKFYVASTSAFVGTPISSGASAELGQSVVSCSKATDVLNTYAAGASFLQPAAGVYYPYIYAEVLRGLTIGWSAKPSAVSYGTVYTYSPFSYDCTFLAWRDIANGDSSGGVLATGTNVRCTLTNRETTSPAPPVTLGAALWDCTITCAGTPAILFDQYSNYPSRLVGVDCSGIAAPLFNTSIGYSDSGSVSCFTGVRIGAGQPLTPNSSATTRASGISNGSTLASYVDSGSPTGSSPIWTRSGAVTRSGGANDGVSAMSMAIPIRYARRSFIMTMYNTRIEEGFDLTFYFVYILPAGVGLSYLTSCDFWLDVLYLNSATTTESTFVTTCDPDMIGLVPTGAGSPALPASTVVWSGAPGGAIKGQLTVRVNPRAAGPIYITVNAWVSPWLQQQHTGNSNTETPMLYLDPIPVVSNVP